MRRLPLSFCHALVTVAGLATLLPTAHAQAPAAKMETGATATEACESAARQALVGQAAVTFNTAPAIQESLSNDSQVVLRGVARWRGPAGLRSVSYSCNVELPTFKVIGLVLRDSTPAVAAAPAPPAPAEPDLSALSPEACESSAVAALKQRWPQASQISFDTASRRFRQQSLNQAELHGTGLAVPGPRSPFTLFEFNCEIDPRDGRVLRTSVPG